jgi:signal transduction histidine kinase
VRSGKNGTSSARLALWAKGGMGLAAALLVAAVFQWGLRITNPGVFYVLTVSVCGFLGGYSAAFAAVPVLCLAIALVYSVPGHPFTYAPGDGTRLAVVVISVPTCALLVSILKARADRSLAASEARIVEQVRDLSLLHEVSRALLFGLSPTDIPEYLCGLVVDRLSARTAFLGTVNGLQDPMIKPTVIRGEDPQCQPPAAQRTSPAAVAAANAKPVVLRDLHADPRADGWRNWAAANGYAAAACIPLIGPDRVLAVLSVFFDTTEALDEPRSNLLQSLANLAAIALSEAHAKEQIRRSQARLEMAMDAGRMGAFDWDLASGRLAWEANHAALFGMDPAQFDGRFETFAARVHPDDLGLIERGIETARATRGLFEQEYRAVWPDGSQHWIAARGRFVYDDAGRAVRMSGIVLDVDRRRHAEDVARQQQAQLAHVQRLNLLNQLASGLAHEINQPLTAISNFAGAALQLHRDGRLTADAARDLFAEAHAQVQRAGEIVRRTRGFMRKHGPEVVPTDLAALIGDALALMRAELARWQVRAAFDAAAASRLPRVRIDPVQIQQVLVNLIQNAVDAMSEVPVERRTLTVSVAGSLERVIVRVSDAGKGIVEGDLARVFDSFFSTKATGLGMGLNISRSIVESHGGSLTAVNNQPPPGATFEFVLPIGE